jgi:hypothetical protein
MSTSDIPISRLDDQINWYDTKSIRNQRWFKSLKMAELILAGSVPVLAGLNAPNIVTAIVGAIVIIAESVIQMNQYYYNWLVYRSTCEELKHEKYLYAANAGIYSTAREPLKLLAERVEGLISKEHAKWVSAQEEAAKTKRAAK